MNNNFTRIAVILDRSGSMSSVRDSTISSFNEFVNSQKGNPGHAKLKLVQFDDRYETTFDNYLPEIPQLSLATYQPRGMTALYDAQGKTIRALGQELSEMKEEDRPGKVMVVTITDGDENSSHEYSRKQIADLIKTQTDQYSWDFVFLAANQDAVKTAQQFNVKASKAMTFGANDADVKNMTMGLSNYVTSYRSFNSAQEASASVGFSDEERERSVSNVGGKK